MNISYYSRMRTSIVSSLGVGLSVGLTVGCTGGGKTTVGSSEGSSSSSATTEMTSGSESDSSSGTTISGSASDSSSATMTASSGSTTDTTNTTDTTGTTGTTNTTSTTGGAACDGSTPIDQADVEPGTPSGFELCPDGTIHRVEATQCESPATPDSCTDNSGGGGCSSAADCTDAPHGSCQQDQEFGGVLPSTTCSCVYGCATDDECETGEICRCAGSGLGLYTECIDGGCVDDDECGDNLCGLSPDTCEPGGFVTACHGEGDLCANDSECPDFQPCYYDQYGDPAVWLCQDAVCGRPFLIDSVARQAPVVEVAAPRTDRWAVGLRPSTEHLSPGQCEQLAEHWSAIAAMEHASVASFARAILDLIAVGAPADLLQRTQSALADEIRHAQRCFGLASAYAGLELGPGPMSMEGAMQGAADRRRIAEAVAREACVAETIAAAEARAASESATDPVIRQTLAEIAEEEEEHARLGWRTLEWLLEDLSEESRGEVMAALEGAMVEALNEVSTLANGDMKLEPFGVLSPASRAAVVRCAVDEIVRPCARAISASRAA